MLLLCNADVHAPEALGLRHVMIGGGKANVELVTTVRHIEPGATSRQRVRSILGGEATGTYLGKVAVAHGVQSQVVCLRMYLDCNETGISI